MQIFSTLSHLNHRIVDHQTPTSPKGDVTYDSQLSLETNPPVDAFTRDAIGRRSMSEKHHAALDAKETGTYQRNKKLREQRERDRKIQGKLGVATSMGSMESISSNANEKRDQVGELGPSLGLKKSSSLESLQTMVQEIQMSDEPRTSSLRTPRGRGREESLRAAVERPTENSNLSLVLKSSDRFILIPKNFTFRATQALAVRGWSQRYRRWLYKPKRSIPKFAKRR